MWSNYSFHCFTSFLETFKFAATLIREKLQECNISKKSLDIVGGNVVNGWHKLWQNDFVTTKFVCQVFWFEAANVKGVHCLPFIVWCQTHKTMFSGTFVGVNALSKTVANANKVFERRMLQGTAFSTWVAITTSTTTSVMERVFENYGDVNRLGCVRMNSHRINVRTNIICWKDQIKSNF